MDTFLTLSNFDYLTKHVVLKLFPFLRLKGAYPYCSLLVYLYICDGKHPVTVKCAHILLPLVILVTSINKSVRRDVRTMCEIGKNGKQYLNIV